MYAIQRPSGENAGLELFDVVCRYGTGSVIRSLPASTSTAAVWMRLPRSGETSKKANRLPSGVNDAGELRRLLARGQGLGGTRPVGAPPEQATRGVEDHVLSIRTPDRIAVDARAPREFRARPPLPVVHPDVGGRSLVQLEGDATAVRRHAGDLVERRRQAHRFGSARGCPAIRGPGVRSSCRSGRPSCRRMTRRSVPTPNAGSAAIPSSTGIASPRTSRRSRSNGTTYSVPFDTYARCPVGR